MPSPVTTYRLQLRREFGFRDAAAVVPYLADLGVSHVYCSPILQAVPGSAHGYDVIDHARISDDLGGAAGFEVLATACREHGLGVVLDIVPNHMAWPTPEQLNPVLWDVLRHGRESSYAHWLDVDWDVQGGKILLPVLGKPLRDAIADGEIVVDTGAAVVRYFDHEFPLAPNTSTLDEQHYRLAHWRTGNDELNYRRFFDVTTLMGVRVELPDVFDATHATLLPLLAPDGPVDGLRIDHPDGLADPGGYLDRLAEASHGTWTVVEKILAEGERLPPMWKCAGTSGYDALNVVTWLFIDRPDPVPEATEEVAELAVAKGMRQAVHRTLGAEVDRAVRELLTLPDAARADLTYRGLRDAVEDLLARMPVYRAYPEYPEGVTRVIEALRTVDRSHDPRGREIDWVIGHLLDNPRLMQTAGPVRAKGLEDTAVYRSARLLATREVGSDLLGEHFGRSEEQFHDHCVEMATQWPETMTTLSTHDTKRSEDVRARLVTLLDLNDGWADTFRGWHRRIGGGGARFDYFLLQTLVAAWPIDEERIQAYFLKANREAKRHTTWTEPDEEYEAEVRARISRIYADDQLMADIGRFVDEQLREPALTVSLAQKLVQLTMPGVADVYQGCELEDYSLVDPDNRRPVDYDRRRQALADLTDPKLRVTAAAIRLRRERPELLGAPYARLDATGSAARHAIGFLRGNDVATVVTRFPVELARAGGWQGTRIELPGEGWTDRLTGRPVQSTRVADLFAELPVALLTR